MKAKFIKKIKQSSEIYSFYFEPSLQLNYIPGQFIELALPFETNGLRGNKHWFSLSSSPDEKYLAITTRVYKRESKYKKFLAELKPGDQVAISQPMGDFVLPKDNEIELVFVAVGIGITPFRSIINHLPHEKPRKITLVFASKNPEDFIFDDLFSDSDIDYIKHDGQLDINRLRDYEPSLALKTIYVSGPEKTVEKFYKDLQASGIKPERISVDYFHNYD